MKIKNDYVDLLNKILPTMSDQTLANQVIEKAEMKKHAKKYIMKITEITSKGMEFIMEKVLIANGIKKSYASGKIKVPALKDTTFEMNRGEIAVIIGKSGSGKSTLLNVLGGLVPPDSGEVIVDNNSLYTINEDSRAKLRTQKVGFIFQNFNLIDELSVINNIRLPFDIAKLPYNIALEKEITERLGIAHRLKFYPEQLSGGERQRVAIARALLMQPDIILADEPTGNLDLESGGAVMDFVLKSNKEQGQTYIIVTHDMEWTKIATTVHKMSDGLLEWEGAV